MSFLDWFRGRQPQSSKRRWRRHGRRGYDSAATGYRTDGWVTSGHDANTEIGSALRIARNRSRDAYRNQPFYLGAVDKFTDKVVGTGIRPIVDTGDAELDKKAMRLWERWGRQCYPGSRANIYALESMLCRTAAMSGEVLARRRWRAMDSMPGLPPIQVQVFEGDQLDDSLTEERGGNKIIQGVEFNAAGQRRFYHMWRDHPGGGLLIGSHILEQSRVPARDMLMLMWELRPGQVRGLPPMQALIPGLHDLSGYMDAERYRAKGAASTMAFVSGGNPEEGYPDGVDGIAPAVDPDAGDLVEDGDGNPIEQLRPGWIAYLPEGKQITFNSAGAPANVDGYVRVQLHEMAAGSPLSYPTMTGDLSNVNFSSIKFGLTEQNAAVRAFREQVFIPLALEPIWQWFVEAAIAAGLLPNNAELFYPTWSRPQVESADRLNEAKADQLELRNGLASRPGLLRARGADPETINREIAEDKAARAEFGIVIDGDPSQVTTAGGLQPEQDASAE